MIIIATPAPTLLTGLILLAGTTGVPDGAGALGEEDAEVAGGFGAALTNAAAAKRVVANAR